MKNNKNNKIYRISKYTFFIGLFLFVLGTSYALFTVTLLGSKQTRIRTANFRLELLDKDGNNIEQNGNNGYEYEINMDKAVPISDEEGLSSDGFIFKLRNSGSIPAIYTLYLDDVELGAGEQRLDDKYIKYSLRIEDEDLYARHLDLIGANPNRKLDANIINNGTTINYELRIWIDKDAGNEAIDKVFATKLRVVASQYTNKMNITEGTFADTLQKQGIVASINTVNNGLKSTEEDGLYQYTDEKGTITYAYRGANPNNYVTFAGSTWRVLRIQEDGTVKLVKNNTLTNIYISERTDSIGYVKWNDTYYEDVPNYNTSNMKAYLEEWYDSEMSSYDSKIETNSYCVDTEELKYGLWYKKYDRQYGVDLRINEKGLYNSATDSDKWIVKPSVSCRNNDIVKSKVSLITADEAVLSGYGVDYEARNAWFTSTMAGDDIYTISPSYDGGIYILYGSGAIIDDSLDMGYATVPVITLKKNVTVSSGTGTKNNPYVIN